MELINIDPKKTYAFVVGIEKYAWDGAWDLPGAVDKSCKFITWLTKNNVPKDHIWFLLSSLIQPIDSYKGVAGYVEKATNDHINYVLKESLSSVIEADTLLCFYWCGHGAMTNIGERRLLYLANSTEKMPLCVSNDDGPDDLLVYLRSDAVHFRKQIFFFDACADETNLAHDFMGFGPHRSRQISDLQYVIYSTKQFEDSRGLLSDALIKIIKDQDMTLLHNMTQFKDLLTREMENISRSNGKELTHPVILLKNWQDVPEEYSSWEEKYIKYHSSEIIPMIQSCETIQINDLQECYNYVIRNLPDSLGIRSGLPEKPKECTEFIIKNLFKIYAGNNEKVYLPVVAFVSQLAQHPNAKDIKDRLSAWIEKQITQGHLQAEDIEVWQEKYFTQQSHKSTLKPSLLLQLDTLDEELEEFTVQAWLCHAHQSELSSLGFINLSHITASKEYTIGTLSDRIGDLLQEIDEKYILDDEDYIHLPIEIILPAMMLYKATASNPELIGFEDLHNGREVDPLLAVDHPVIIKIVDRHIGSNRRFRRNWSQNWEQVQESDASLLYWLLFEYADMDPNELYANLRANHVFCATFSPSCVNSDKTNQFEKIVCNIIQAGIPVAFWPRYLPDEVRCTSMQWCMSRAIKVYPLSEFPHAVCQLRRDAIRNPGKFPWVRYLRVVYDDPKRYPPEFLLQFKTAKAS